MRQLSGRSTVPKSPIGSTNDWWGMKEPPHQSKFHFITPNSGWERSSTGEKLHWNVDKYFHEGAYEQPGLGDKKRMLFFHRTLTSYINTLLKTGFVLEGLVEPKPSEEMIRKYPSFREDDRCADFIIFQVKK